MYQKFAPTQTLKIGEYVQMLVDKESLAEE